MLSNVFNFKDLTINLLGPANAALNCVSRNVQYGEGSIHEMRGEVTEALGSGLYSLKSLVESELNLKPDVLHTLSVQPRE